MNTAQISESQHLIPREIEHRLIKLETQWENVHENFAKTAETASLRTDIKETENKIIMWVAGAILATLIGFLSMFFSLQSILNARIDKLDAKIEKISEQINSIIRNTTQYRQ